MPNNPNPTGPTVPAPTPADPAQGAPAGDPIPEATDPPEANNSTNAAPTSENTGSELESMEPADLARMVRELRRENGAARTNAKAQAAAEAEQNLTHKLAQALGLGKEGDAAPSVDDLTAQLADRDAEVRAMRTERAAEQAIRAGGGDIDAMLDSRSFRTKLDGLDPEADSFAEDLGALVAAEVDANPRYKAQGAQAARGGGDFSGGSGDRPQTFTHDQIQNMTPTEYAANRDAIMRQLGNG